MKKKLLAIIAMVAMIATMIPTMAFAGTITEGWQGAKVEGNKITLPEGKTDENLCSYSMRGDEITAEAKTYEVIVDLSKDYEHGELFQISLGFGTDADNYSTEFVVMTQKNGDKFEITSGVAPNQSITIDKAGIYTYKWTVKKDDAEVKAQFAVEGVDGTLDFTVAAHMESLNNSKCVRYMWAFGADQGQQDYQLSRPLVLYKEKPVIKEVNVVDGADGYTPVETPAIGQKLIANVLMADGTTIGSYPVDGHISYVWSYEGSDIVLGTDPVYTVTEDNYGKKITVAVKSINGYEGAASWKATYEVGSVPATPVEPATPVDPATPTDPATPDKDGTPKTGDDTNMLLPIGLAFAALIGIGGVVATRRRHS